MRKTAVSLMLMSLIYGSSAVAQVTDGRLKGTVGGHQFDVAVKCEIERMGKKQVLSARTDGNMHNPMKDTNGDGIAGQVSAMGDKVAVELAFAKDVYKFGGGKSVNFRDGGFSWKDTMYDYDNDKARAHLKAGKPLKDLAPERKYEIDLDLSCK